MNDKLYIMWRQGIKIIFGFPSFLILSSFLLLCLILTIICTIIAISILYIFGNETVWKDNDNIISYWIEAIIDAWNQLVLYKKEENNESKKIKNYFTKM